MSKSILVIIPTFKVAQRSERIDVVFEGVRNFVAVQNVESTWRAGSGEQALIVLNRRAVRHQDLFVLGVDMHVTAT